MLGYIYKITNLINGKIYVGQHSKSDCSMEELDTSYWASGIKINLAFKKYGKENFCREIICWCNTEEELNNKEKYYIAYYNATDDNIGYNIAEGGVAGHMIAGYTEEEKEMWKANISKAVKEAMQSPEIYERFMKGIQNRSTNQEWKDKLAQIASAQPHKPMSEETKAKLREINLGNKYGIGNKSRTGYKNSDEMNERISKGAKKVKHTKQWNDNVSKSLRGKPKSEAHKQALRKPKPKYKWLLPNGEIKIMDASNGGRHKDWVRLEKID